MEVYPCQDSKENTFEIDGQMLNSSDDYIKWDKIKTIIYSIIRGDKRPMYMKIILKEDEKYSCDEYISYILDITFNQSLKIKSEFLINNLLSIKASRIIGMMKF